ncbi:hypothetical protein RUND412_011302, partial [Rhizina undulata]
NKVCAVTGSVTGQLYDLRDDYLALSFDYNFSHMWWNFGIIIDFWIFFVFTYAFATEVDSLGAGKGEFLIFRKGHEPEYLKRALESGRLSRMLKALVVPRNSRLTKTTALWNCRNWLRAAICLLGKTAATILSCLTERIGDCWITYKASPSLVLAQRINTGAISGDIPVSGSPLDQSFHRGTGYVQQQDLRLAKSTVREALRFSALLCQPKAVPLEEYFETVIKMLEMEDYASAVIGTPGSGLNVEQRKRTTNGVERFAKPAILLFLDKPTSGLDSQSAWSIFKFLQKLAATGQAILCVIHQPSAMLFKQFDCLLLLKKGGQTVFFVDNGKNSRTMIDYFERNGGGKYILDVIGSGAIAHVKKDWDEVWNNSTEKQQVSKEIAAFKA